RILVGQARRRFERGECQEARDSDQRIAKRQKEVENEKARLTAHLQVVTRAVAATTRLVDETHQITLLIYLTGGLPPISESARGKPLPSLAPPPPARTVAVAISSSATLESQKSPAPAVLSQRVRVVAAPAAPTSAPTLDKAQQILDCTIQF